MTEYIETLEDLSKNKTFLLSYHEQSLSTATMDIIQETEKAFKCKNYWNEKIVWIPKSALYWHKYEWRLKQWFKNKIKAERTNYKYFALT